MYCVGAVWRFLMDFSDGKGERRKYCVLLNTPIDAGDYYWAAVTTSKAFRYHGETGSPCGCPDVPCFRIEEGEESCFPERTWVQFDNTHRLRREKLDELCAAGKAGFVQTLAPDRARAVMNCALKSVDLPGVAQEFIKKTLKAMRSPARHQIPVVQMPSGIEGFPLDDTERVRKQIEALVDRSALCGLLKISAEDLASTLSGPLTSEFTDEALLALELLSESQ